MDKLSLTDRLKKTVEFDAEVPRQESYRRDEIQMQELGEEYLNNYSFIEGARFESDRLQPILTALIECVAALESVSANKTQTVYSHSEDFRQGANVAFGQSAERADEALSRLEKELGCMDET